MEKPWAVIWHEAENSLENDRVGCKNCLALNFYLNDLQSNLAEESINTGEGKNWCVACKITSVNLCHILSVDLNPVYIVYEKQANDETCVNCNFHWTA